LLDAFFILRYQTGAWVEATTASVSTRRRRTCRGSRGGGCPPLIDFNGQLARLVRYFGQSPDYWLDTCTLHDWNTIWCRELINTPPVDQIAAAYVGYKAPDLDDLVPGDDGNLEEWECPFPDVTD
jgi:hypothetical protein